MSAVTTAPAVDVVARVLVDAADLLDLHGRARLVNLDYEGRLCARAALKIAAPDGEAYMAARDRLLAHLVPTWPANRTLTIPLWNDNTADDALITAAMREAAS